MRLYTMDDRLQSFNTNYCGPFQLYIYLNLFKPSETSVVAQAESKKLYGKLLCKLLNKLFSLNSRHNEKMLDAFILEHFIDFAGRDAPME